MCFFINYLIVSDVEDETGLVVDNCPVLEFPLSLDEDGVPRLGPPALHDPVHQDALLDLTVLRHVAPHVLGLVRRDVVSPATAAANTLTLVITATVVAALVTNSIPFC